MKYDFKYYQNRMYQENYIRNIYLKIGFAFLFLISIIIIGVLN